MTYLALSKYKVLCALLVMATATGLLMTTTTQPAQAVSTTLVVSQVYGGGGNAGAQFTNDFIEIFNRGTTPVDVTGWSVQYAAATGTTWQVTPICATGPCLIQPGKYFLVQEAAGAASPAPLPTPDAIGTIAMSGTAGKVALVNTTVALSGACPAGAQIIDFVGYGVTANCFEGAGPAPAPSNTTSDQRFRGGCQESDSNSVDFLAAAPLPRNSASPTNTCNATNPNAFRNKRADFDADNKSDVSVWRPSDHNWYILQSGSGNSLRTVIDWGAPGDIAVPGDYDGDNMTDTAVYRPSEGNWYIIQSSTNTPTLVGWGTSNDIPVPGDFDADGRTDVAVYRPSEGNWYIIGSTIGRIIRQWGANGDIPIPNSDFDGDARADLAVYRPSENNWYIRASNGVAGTSIVVSWGASGDRLVPADYDGDRKTDVAVWRPSEGNWYIRNSTNTVSVRGWGNSSDLPVPGDYDGDNRYDIAVWRPSEGNWYILNSGNGTPFVSVVNLGVSGDVPVPFAYLPPNPVP